MKCRQSSKATTGFRVVSNGLLRAENAWTTLELRPDSACLEPAWPSFISRNLRSHPPQSGVLLRRRGRIQTTGGSWRVKHSGGYQGVSPFHQSRSEHYFWRQREEESKGKQVCQFFFLFVFFYVPRNLFVYPSRVWFPWQNYPLPYFCVLFNSPKVIEAKKGLANKNLRISLPLIKDGGRLTFKMILRDDMSINFQDMHISTDIWQLCHIPFTSSHSKMLDKMLNVQNVENYQF